MCWSVSALVLVHAWTWPKEGNERARWRENVAIAHGDGRVKESVKLSQTLGI